MVTDRLHAPPTRPALLPVSESQRVLCAGLRDVLYGSLFFRVAVVHGHQFGVVDGDVLPLLALGTVDAAEGHVGVVVLPAQLRKKGAGVL